MNYNGFNDNGKEKINVSSIFTDKKYRSRVILAFYVVFIIILIVFVRISYSNQSSGNNSNLVNNNTSIKNEELNKNNDVVETKQDDDNETLDEIDKMFSYIDLNNYEFKFTTIYNNDKSIIEGKRFNNKFEFSLNSKEGIIYFNGTSNYIKAKYDNSDYKLVSFPYVIYNYFDSDLIKETVKQSILNENIYEISNEKIANLIKSSKIDNLSKLNKIELVTRNNKVVEIRMDLTNLVSSYTKDKVNTNLILEYFNFDLVDDFKLE